MEGLDSTRAFLRNVKRIVIKVGTAVVTRADGRLAVGRLGALCEQIEELNYQGYEIILVASGAVGVGRQRLRYRRLVNSSFAELQKPQVELDGKACAAVGQNGLMAIYDTLFSQLDVTSAQLLVTDNDFRDPNFRKQLTETVKSLLSLKVVPIFNENDAISTRRAPYEDSSGIFWDNDSLAALLALELKADLLVLLSDVDGLYSGPPSDPKSKLIHTYVKERLEGVITFGEKSRLGRGGMTAKVKSAVCAADAGIPVVITSGLAGSNIIKILRGERIGTLFHRDAHKWVPVEHIGVREMAVAARESSRRLQAISSKERSKILLDIADALQANEKQILAENEADVAVAQQAGYEKSLVSRLEMSSEKISSLANAIRVLANMKDPIGHVLNRTEARNGYNPKIQNLNSHHGWDRTSEYRRPIYSKDVGKGSEERHLSNFIWAHNDLVDTEILEKLNIGDKKAIAAALEQIHYRSLEHQQARLGKYHQESGGVSRRYSEVLSGNASRNFEFPEDKNEEWKQVTYKKKVKKVEIKGETQDVTIFLHGIPDEANGRDIWSLFSNCGNILDIILPKKRDRLGKRFGFVKTTDEKEAGAIISNAKMDRKLGHVIKMSINQSTVRSSSGNRVKASSAPKQNHVENKSTNQNPDPVTNPEVSTPQEQDDKQNADKENFKKKMFEFIEVEVDTEVEEALMESKIGYTWFEEDIVGMQERFRDIGLGYLKVLSLSKRKFIISKDKKQSWDEFNNTDLSVWFTNIRDYEEEDHLMSRIVWLECLGLPMPAWKEDNLKAFTDRMGKWISWSYQSDNLGELFNPLICLDMANFERIQEEMKILYKGRQITIVFKEVTDLKYLQGKVLPMEFAEEDVDLDKMEKNDQASSSKKDSVSKQEIIRIHKESGADKNKELVLLGKNWKQHEWKDCNNAERLVQELHVEEISDSVSLDSKIQDNIFADIRGKSGSSEICSAGSSKHEEANKSDVGKVSTVASSQSTLCSGIARKLKVKSNRGRPRKLNINNKNPFEIGGSFKLRCKGKGKNKISQKAKRKNVIHKSLQVVPSKVIGSTVKQALEILEAAENMGLTINGDREVVVKEIAKQLEFHEL